MPILDLPNLSIQLDRYPLRRNELLQAWDAADEYLLKHLHESGSPDPGSLLLINDSFGALGTALCQHRPTCWNDSHLSRLALEHNLALNGRDSGNITFVPGDRPPRGPVDLALMKIPKSLGFLEDVLWRLRPHLRSGSQLVAGGMIKHTPARVFRLLEKTIGPVRTSLGWKKARLAICSFDPELGPSEQSPENEIHLEEFGWTLTSRAGVFSGDHLDLGTRLLLKHLPADDRPYRAADLGCGNGVLALVLSRLCPNASVFGVDESYQAVASARDNIARTGLTGRDITFAVADGLKEVEPGSFDLVVCNPPFHQGQVTGDHIAWRMFEQASQALRIGGQLRIVGNRHLGYHGKLKRLFGNCEVLDSNPKFVVLRATKQDQYQR